jgi:hypothetical protein
VRTREGINVTPALACSLTQWSNSDPGGTAPPRGPWRLECDASPPETGAATISAGKGFGPTPDRKENLKQARMSLVHDHDQEVVYTSCARDDCGFLAHRTKSY